MTLDIPRFARVIFAIIAGSLQTLTLAPFGLWFLGPLSIAMLLWLITQENEQATLRPSAALGWWFGVGLFGSGSSWIYVSIHVYGYASPALAGTLTLLFVLGLALFPALAFYILEKLKPRGHFTIVFGLIGIWILCDLFRAWFLTGFPWLYLGYAHQATWLSGWAPIFGVHGLSAFTLLTGSAIWLAFSRAGRSTRWLLCIPVISVWVLGLWLSTVNWTTPTQNTAQRVALVQLNVPQELKWLPSQRRKTIRKLADITAELSNTDLVIWPETAVPIIFDQAQNFLNRMSILADQNEMSIVTGIPFRTYDKDDQRVMHNSIVAIGNGSGIYHKQKLVPFGEYVPLQSLLRGLIAFFDLPMSDFRTGEPNQPPLMTGPLKAATLICYEVVYPDFTANAAQNTDYLITISNDSWFGDSIGPLQHLEMAQMRALETGRYVLRGTNNGVTAIIDDKGVIQGQTEQFVETTLTGSFEGRQGSTPFMRWGSWPIALLSLVILTLIGLRGQHGK